MIMKINNNKKPAHTIFGSQETTFFLCLQLAFQSIESEAKLVLSLLFISSSMSLSRFLKHYLSKKNIYTEYVDGYQSCILLQTLISSSERGYTIESHHLGYKSPSSIIFHLQSLNNISTSNLPNYKISVIFKLHKIIIHLGLSPLGSSP